MTTESDLLPAAPVQRPEIVDPRNAPVLFVDWIVSAGMFEDVVNLSLGSIDHSFVQAETDVARIIIATRLRMSKPFAIRMHRAIGQALGLPLSAGEEQGEPPYPPKNLFN
jgi:hypothetical protein